MTFDAGSAASFVWLLVAVFMLYRSYRRFRQTSRHRSTLLASGKNGGLLIAASGNVRRATYGMAAAAVAIALTGFQVTSDPSELRGAVLAGGVIAILAVYASSVVRDDADTERLMRYIGNDKEAAKESTLVAVKQDVAVVIEKVDVAADAAQSARDEASRVRKELAALTDRALASERRADDAEVRADDAEAREGEKS